MNKKKVVLFIFVVFVYTYLNGENVNIKEKIIQIEKETGEWVYAGDIINRSKTFNFERTNNQSIYQENISFLFKKDILTENQQIIAILLIQNKNLDTMIELLDTTVDLYLNNELSERIVEIVLYPLGTNYVLQKNYRNKEIKEILKKIIISENSSITLKNEIHLFLRGKWWRTIKRSDSNWKNKV